MASVNGRTVRVAGIVPISTRAPKYGIIACEQYNTERVPGQSVPRGYALGKGELQMAAMKPRTGDGPMEVTKEGRSLILRLPLEGGGRLVVEMNADEARSLKECLVGVTE